MAIGYWPLADGYWLKAVGCWLKSFVSVSQRTYFVFWQGGHLHRPSTFAAFYERVSLIIPLLFHCWLLVFVFIF
ncbi:MAG: hypothetical protein UHS32_06380, partial [Bacteroidaceae bacterium]|nr:hypothetical protein [Bacteroidaceae bacterium]